LRIVTFGAFTETAGSLPVYVMSRFWRTAPAVVTVIGPCRGVSVVPGGTPVHEASGYAGSGQLAAAGGGWHADVVTWSVACGDVLPALSRAATAIE
jgi:hypothetical protein